MKKKCTLNVWRTIQLGTHNSDSMIAAIEKQGGCVSNLAKKILDKVRFGSKKTISLVVVAVTDLGFPNGATTKEIFDVAKKQGLALCPAEVGPQLRLQYMDQPIDELLFIAMKPVLVDREFVLFRVYRDFNDYSLCSSYGCRKWLPVNLFVFVVR